MSDFSIFMAGNVVESEIYEYPASKRYLTNEPELDENGEKIVTGKDAKGNPIYKMKPVNWKIKAIDSDLDEALRKDCTKKVPSGKRGQFTQELDTDKYIGKMCVACTVYPDLNNAELQDSYKVKSADALLKRMLLPGEYTDYKSKVMEVNGYDMSMEELVDEAKN